MLHVSRLVPTFGDGEEDADITGAETEEDITGSDVAVEFTGETLAVSITEEEGEAGGAASA